MDRGVRSTSPWEYIDFELEIHKGSRRKYTVCARSPEGEAQEEMRFPFDKGELKDKLKDLETAVLRSGRKRRRIRTPEVQAVQNFGQKLFQALLSGEIRAHYDLSLRQAKRQNKGLRLKLRIQPAELAVLPWEFLYDPGRNSYLCLSSKTPLVRYLELREPVEQLAVSPPLKILGMVASPSDLAPLDVEHEKRRVEEAIKDLQTQGRVELTWLEGQTSRDLQRAMIRGPWHVFHFIGHGDFDPETEEGLIAFANEEGYARLLPAEDLALLLKDHWDLRLVLLNSCEGARGSESDAFSSTAATLVRPGIPAVLANQYEITDEAAIEFSRTFYQAVADGLPVDAAVSYARTSLKIEIDNTLEWATPVLYMRSPDGRIFDISSEAQPVKPPQEEETREEALRQYREGVKLLWADGELDRHEVEWLRDLANNKLELSSGTSARIEREVMGDTFDAILERQERIAKEEENRKARPEETEAKGGSQQSTKPGGGAKTGPAATGGSPKSFLPRSKRALWLATAVGILLVLLTGGVALGLTGIGTAASLLGGPESRPVGENPPDQPPNSQQDTAAGEQGVQEPPSTKPPSTKPPEPALPDPAPSHARPPSPAPRNAAPPDPPPSQAAPPDPAPSHAATPEPVEA